MRHRFILAGPRAFLDYEIIEMLLAQVLPRGDTKAMAYSLIAAANSVTPVSSKRPILGPHIAAVLHHSLSLYFKKAVNGFGPAMSTHLAAVKEAATRIAQTSCSDAPILSSWNAVGNYCRHQFEAVARPSIFILLLDYMHRLVATPIRFAIDEHIAIIERQTVVAALRHGASGLIVVRVDPDATLMTGHRDHEIARKIRDAGAPASVLMHDYIVVAGDSFMSLRSMGVLEVATAYEVDSPHDSASRNGWYADPEEELTRLQAIAAAGDAGSLRDTELLSLLLRRAAADNKRASMAEDLIARFGNLGQVLAAPIDEVIHVLESLPEAYRPGNPEAAAVQLGVIGEACQRMLRAQILAAPPLADMAALVRYCRAALAYGEVEHLHALFLTEDRHLLWDEVISRGTVNAAPVQPREIASRAVRLGAAFVVLVHNHPTGDPEPSQADVTMTLQVDMVCRSVGVQVLDHIIVAVSGHVSLADAGRMPRMAGDMTAGAFAAEKQPKRRASRRKRPPEPASGCEVP